MMSKVLQRLNVLAIWLLGGALALVLVAQIWPGGRPLARAGAPDDEGAWPKTLEVYPPHPGDPVKLVRIMKGGKEILPGAYRMPELVGDHFSGPNPFADWLSDTSFVVRNQASRNIVCVGICVVVPARRTDLDCDSSPGEAWCGANPHWCDGGCPVLLQRALHWGRIPGVTKSGLEVRLRTAGRLASPVLHVGVPLQGQEWPGLGSGQEAELSLAGRVDGWITLTDPRKDFSDTMNGILRQEGIEEAVGTQPCNARAYSKTGCAFTEVPKFNIGVDVVYFDDGTIWGNYGYGYAVPNPDGVFTRVDASDFPGILGPAPEPN